MIDETEDFRRQEVARLNSEVQSNDATAERKRLEQQHGKVWDTEELQKEFEVLGFMAPYISVMRLSDRKRGMMQFQHMPRFYFNFKEM